MKKVTNLFITILAIGILMTSCKVNERCFNCERHDGYKFKAQINLPVMDDQQLRILDNVLSGTKLNERYYLEQLRKMPLVKRRDVINYLNYGTIPKGYEPTEIKLFVMPQKLEVERVRQLLDSDQKEMRNLGMIMVGAHVKEFYPVNYELMEGKREKLSEKEYINYCKSQLAEIESLETERVDEDPLKKIQAQLKGIKHGMGSGWG